MQGNYKKKNGIFRSTYFFDIFFNYFNIKKLISKSIFFSWQLEKNLVYQFKKKKKCKNILIEKTKKFKFTEEREKNLIFSLFSSISFKEKKFLLNIIKFQKKKLHILTEKFFLPIKIFRNFIFLFHDIFFKKKKKKITI